jgi:hypothetical protein
MQTAPLHCSARPRQGVCVRSPADTDGKLDSPFSDGYTDFCPNLPRLTDTSEWPQFSFAAGVVPRTE